LLLIFSISVVHKAGGGQLLEISDGDGDGDNHLGCYATGWDLGDKKDKFGKKSFIYLKKFRINFLLTKVL
jgi:hypothetical protein